MELHKVEDVDFRINQGPLSEGNINLILKEGELYLSFENVVLTDGKRWYDLPIKELDNIQVMTENPVKLRFVLQSLEVIVTGKSAERLLALRHFLLPYIQPKREAIMKENLTYLIKFWSVGIRNPQPLALLLPLTVEEINILIESAYKDNLITKEGKLTELALEMFPPKEKEILEKLEAING
jgi:hypothetical protein